MKFEKRRKAKSPSIDKTCIYFILPGCCSGILLAFQLVLWLTGMDWSDQPSSMAWLLLLFPLMGLFIILGGLIGSFVWLYVLSHSLSAEELTNLIERQSKPSFPMFTPAFKAVGMFIVRRKARKA